MASTSTAREATASTALASKTPTASLSVRHRLRTFGLVAFLGFLLLGAATYAYLWHGWFESAYLGQTLLLRHIYEAGPEYRAKRSFGLFPRAQGLLHEPFTHNEWKITSRDGYTLYHKKPTWWAVPLSQIPHQVRSVFVFREDRRFYRHAGADLRALLRAMLKTLTGRKQGASTIAMQVAKHCLLDYGNTPTRTGLRGLVRKLRDMLLALRLVKVEGRDKILAYYLNHATMGPGLRGIGPAAWDYFRKQPHALSIGEAAQIAVLLPSPSLSPRHSRHRARYEAERRALLRRMHEAGALDQATYRQALRPSKIHPHVHYKANMAAPQSVATAFRAIDPVLQRFNLGHTPQQLRRKQPFPLHVRVSLHAQLSWRFYQAMAPALQSQDLKYTALILVDARPVVLVGGDLDLYHYAFHAPRQVGSVSKLFFYEAVWQLGYMHPKAIVTDGDLPEPLRQRLGRPQYQPRNDDGQWRTPLAHHQSLSQSVNKMAYRTTWGERTEAQRHSVARVLVQRFGLPWQHFTQRGLQHFYTAFSDDESVALGTWHATPFDVATMLEKGFRGSTISREHLILSWNGKPMVPSPVAATPGLSRPLFRALRNAVAATAPDAVVDDAPWTLAAKTGTTDGGRDAWFAGFLIAAADTQRETIYPRITFVVWAGYDDNRAAGLYGGKMHGPIFGRLLRDAGAQAALHALLQERP